MTDAECAKLQFFDQLFFPEQGRGNHSTYEIVRKICRRCVVREECLATAMETERNEPTSLRAGMWGGLTPRERSALEKQLIASGVMPPRGTSTPRSYDWLVPRTNKRKEDESD